MILGHARDPSEFSVNTCFRAGSAVRICGVLQTRVMFYFVGKHGNVRVAENLANITPTMA